MPDAFEKVMNGASPLLPGLDKNFKNFSASSCPAYVQRSIEIVMLWRIGFWGKVLVSPFTKATRPDRSAVCLQSISRYPCRQPWTKKRVQQ